MKIQKFIVLIIPFAAFAVCLPSFAGTTVIDFNFSTGLLNDAASGTGELTGFAGAAQFSDPNITLLEQGSGYVGTGTTTASMTLRPASQATSPEGLVFVDIQDFSNQITAMLDWTGLVTLKGVSGQFVTAQIHFPATETTLTLEYNAYTERATVYINGTSEGFLETAMNGAPYVKVGVKAEGPASFSSFTSTGPSIPDYPADIDEDGVADTDEVLEGTNPYDPGNLPVINSIGADVHALNGTRVVFPAGALTPPVTIVTVSTPTSIPPGTLPPGLFSSTAFLKLEPDGAVFNTPVTVTFAYPPDAITLLYEPSLTPYFFDGSNYSNDGITVFGVDQIKHTIAFSTTHFTTFLLAGSLRDSDGDDIDDAWELYWFGNLTTANDTSNYDGDTLLDVEEFQHRFLGADPKTPGETVPLGGMAAAACMAIGLAAAGLRRLRGK
jgi:hypothetical protein